METDNPDADFIKLIDGVLTGHVTNTDFCFITKALDRCLRIKLLYKTGMTAFSAFARECGFLFPCTQDPDGICLTIPYGTNSFVDKLITYAVDGAIRFDISKSTQCAIARHGTGKLPRIIAETILRDMQTVSDITNTMGLSSDNIVSHHV